MLLLPKVNFGMIVFETGASRIATKRYFTFFTLHCCFCSFIWIIGNWTTLFLYKLFFLLHTKHSVCASCWCLVLASETYRPVSKSAHLHFLRRNVAAWNPFFLVCMSLSVDVLHLSENLACPFFFYFLDYGPQLYFPRYKHYKGIFIAVVSQFFGTSVGIFLTCSFERSGRVCPLLPYMTHKPSQ